MASSVGEEKGKINRKNNRNVEAAQWASSA
jgi:hypothetical protein